MKTNKIQRTIIFLVTFIYIFSPKFVFLPIDLSYIIMAISFIYLFIDKNVQFIFSKYVNTIFYLIAFALIWLVLEVFKNNSYTTNSYPVLLIRIVLEIFIPSCLLTNFYRKMDIDYPNFIKKMICIQIIFCVLMINMDFKEYMFSNVLEIDEYTSKFNFIRNFGIGRNYLSAFPACCALLGFILFLNFYYSKKISSLIFFILNNIILILNSRTSLVIELFCIFSSVFVLKYKVFLNNTVYIGTKKKMNKKKKIQLFYILLLIFFIVINFIIKNEEFFQKIGEWLLSALTSIKNLFYKEDLKYDTFKDLNHWYLPNELLSMFFGYANPAPPKMASDIGYVRYTLYGGLLFLIFINSFFCLLYFEVVLRCRNYGIQVYLTICYLSLLILQYKGDILGCNEVTRLVILSTIYIDNIRFGEKKC